MFPNLFCFIVYVYSCQNNTSPLLNYMSIFFPIKVWQRVRCLLHVPICFLIFKSLTKFFISIVHHTKQTLFKFPYPGDLVYFVSDKSICKIDKLLKTLAINVLYDSNFFNHYIYLLFSLSKHFYTKKPKLKCFYFNTKSLH